MVRLYSGRDLGDDNDAEADGGQLPRWRVFLRRALRLNFPPGSLFQWATEGRPLVGHANAAAGTALPSSSAASCVQPAASASQAAAVAAVHVVHPYSAAFAQLLPPHLRAPIPSGPTP
jgi:hypothetical protein